MSFSRSLRIERTLTAAAILATMACGMTGCAVRIQPAPGESFNAGPIFAERISHLRHTFIVRNTTGKRTKILEVRASCRMHDEPSSQI